VTKIIGVYKYISGFGEVYKYICGAGKMYYSKRLSGSREVYDITARAIFSSRKVYFNSARALSFLQSHLLAFIYAVYKCFF